MINKPAAVATLIASALIGLLLWLAFHFHGNAVAAAAKVDQLESDNALQAQMVATQAFNFQLANQIAGAAKQYEVQITGDRDAKEIEYRTILKKEPTCALLVPADIADRLLEYTNRLRSGAMHGDTGNANSASAGPVTANSTLTYCQAVLWIDPLLTAIDQANDQLARIRQFEKERR